MRTGGYVHPGVEPSVEALFGDLSVEQVREAAARCGTAGLLAAFDGHHGYRSAAEWNRLVRICEALAVTGWGEREPVEACAERWIDGSFHTHLRDREFQVVGGTERRWARHGSTYVPESGDATDPAATDPAATDPAATRPGATDPGAVKTAVTGLAAQRIPLAKNPLRLARPVAHPPEAEPFVGELSRLRLLFDRRLAKPYGTGFGSCNVHLRFGAATTGFELGRPGNYRGELTVTAVHHCADAGLAAQKLDFVTNLETALGDLARKLRRRAPAYRIDDLRADAMTAARDWL